MTAPATVVGTGIVRGLFVDATGAPIVGLTVKFTPRVSYLQGTGLTPDPTTIAMVPVFTGTTDLDGYLTAAGSPGVELIATDDQNLVPGCFSYQVGYSGHAAASSLRAADIVVPTGSDRWLAEITPSPPAGDAGAATG